MFRALRLRRATGIAGESDVAADRGVARSRATGGRPTEDADSGGSTGTGAGGRFVGRVAGQDLGYAETTGAEARADSVRTVDPDAAAPHRQRVATEARADRRSDMAAPEHALVPALVGLDAADAHELALTAGVAIVGPSPNRSTPTYGTVVAQKPTAGTQVQPGDPVTVWIDTGGDGGGGGGGGSAPRPYQPLPRDPAGVK